MFDIKQRGIDFVKREASNLAGNLVDKAGGFLKSKLQDRIAKW